MENLKCGESCAQNPKLPKHRYYHIIYTCSADVCGKAVVDDVDADDNAEADIYTSAAFPLVLKVQPS